jgi:acetolactate synthase-1/2/3 large subunit
VGTELGAETTQQWTVDLPGLIHIDVRGDHIGRNYPALALVGDAGPVLRSLIDRLPATRDRAGAQRAAEVRDRVSAGLDAQVDRVDDLGILHAIREALSPDAIVAFDMTIAGYMAAFHFEVFEPDTFLYPLGSGTLGYALPAALGAQVAMPGREVVAVHGDGGALYSVFELLTARDLGVPLRLIVIDDGGYGILRLIQNARFSRTAGVDLAMPDFGAFGDALGVPVVQTSASGVGEALRTASEVEGPVLIHVLHDMAMTAWTD